jgi:hypothetical protein
MISLLDRWSCLHLIYSKLNTLHIHHQYYISQFSQFIIDERWWWWFKKFRLFLSHSLTSWVVKRLRRVYTRHKQSKIEATAQHQQHTYFSLLSPLPVVIIIIAVVACCRRFLGSISLSHTFFSRFYFLSTGLTGRIESKDINFNPISLCSD